MAEAESLKLELRHVEAADYPVLFRWYGDAQLPHFWNFHRRILRYRGFVEQLEQMMGSTDLRLICQLPALEPIGYCQAHDLNPWDGRAYLALYLTSDHRCGPEVTEAAMLGLDMVFLTYPMIRKVYSEVYGFASYLQSAFEALGFVEEGVTPNHYWFTDRFWTRLRLALYRDQWQRLRALSERKTV